MKYIIASDLHGSAPCVQELMDAFSRHQADYMLLLGDLLYHGPRNALPDRYGPKQAIELLNGLADRLICVRGNCDAEVDQQVLSFPITADYGWIMEGGRRLFLTHGHLYSPDSPPPFLARGEVMLSGHTHVPAWREQEGRWFLNPGSVSIPKNGSPHSYMTLDGSRFTWYTLDGQPYRTLTLSPDGEGVLE
ncbi:MAG: phosphodiesterase [Oscillospiraceae bacterium]|nr:phosphodiesterase [Oscillospiraceae bacterium]